MATRRRRWFSFSLASLFAVLTLFSIWLARESDRVAKQRKAVALAQRLCANRRLTSYDPFVPAIAYDCQERINGGISSYDPLRQPAAPSWLRKLIGDDYFRRVTIIDLSDTDVTDSDLESLRPLSSLRTLRLYRTAVTEKGVRELRLALPECSIDWTPNEDISQRIFGDPFEFDSIRELE